MLGLIGKKYLKDFPDLDRTVQLEDGTWVSLRPWPVKKKTKPSFRNPKGLEKTYRPATQEEFRQLLKNPGWERYIGDLPDHVAKAYAAMDTKQLPEQK